MNEQSLLGILQTYVGDVYTVARQIQKVAGREVEVKLQQQGQLGFWTDGKKFAQVNFREYGSVIYMGTGARFAIKANVANLAEGITKRGWHFTDDEAFWHARVGNSADLHKAASIFARICKVR